MKLPRASWILALAVILGLAVTPALGYVPASPDRKLEFPRDHGAHRDAAYEWWYFTGHVQAPGNSPELAGFQVTVFRISPASGPAEAHPESLRPAQAATLVVQVAVSDPAIGRFRHHSFSLREREGLTQLTEDGLHLRMPGLSLDWDARQSRMTVTADAGLGDDRVRLMGTWQSRKPIVRHGQHGYSKKGNCPTCASEYSSLTRLEGATQLKMGEAATLRVKEGPASVWFDHEFGTQTLAAEQTGWDWMALQLKDGWDLMLFGVRGPQGKTDFKSGTWINPQGRATSLESAQITMWPEGEWKSSHTQARYPASWRLRVERLVDDSKSGKTPFEAVLRPTFADQEWSESGAGMPIYWEGSCRVLKNDQVIGAAYLEMTGYAPGSRPRF